MRKSKNWTKIKIQSLKITMKQQRQKAEWEWITRCLKCDSPMTQSKKQLIKLLRNMTPYGNT